MGKVIGSLAISYFIIGGVIFGSQLALSTFLDPVCIGAEQHRLLDRYFPPRNQIHELEKTRTGKRDIGDVSWILKSGLHVTQWLPDLYREVIAGTMSARSYLFGGYTCHPRMDIPIRRIQPISGYRGHLLGPDSPSLDEVIGNSVQ
jgi:hypothetical protein